MKLINNSKLVLTHGIPSQDNKDFYKLGIGEVLDVPDEIGKLWLKFDGVKEYAEPADIKKAEDEAKAKEAELEEANNKIAELEAKLKELEADKDNKKEDEAKAKEAATKKAPKNK